MIRLFCVRDFCGTFFILPASSLPEAERCIAMDKLSQARELVGELDALQALLEWKGPQER